MERRPYSDDPAEGARGVDVPEHNTAPDGFAGEADSPHDELMGGTTQSNAGEEHDASSGGDAGAALGGDQGTEDQLDADNAVEEDTLRSLDPDDSPA